MLHFYRASARLRAILI